MNKVLLIIQREYMVRVKKKSFLLMTFLVPGLIFAMYAIAFLLIKKNGQELSVVNVIDKSGVFATKLKDNKNIKYTIGEQDIVKAKAQLKSNEAFYILEIPADYNHENAVQVFSSKKPGLDLVDEIKDQMDDISTSYQMVKAGIDTAQLHKIKSKLSISARQVTAEGEKDASVVGSVIMGIAGAILIYISLFIYGAQVMRGVIEEKTNRIIEVIVSSVKPFQLMLGKIIGVGMVGLTQFMLWIILSITISTVASTFMFKNKAPVKTEVNGKSIMVPQTMPQSPAVKFFSGINSDNVVKELGGFIFYFLTGYLLYSALFAAVGSAVDSETETQQFMLPITMPLLFTYILSVTYLFQAPNSTLAVWLSMIPFTAPVVMMVRMPFDPPVWQIVVSAIMMIIGFLFTTWVAARIYRVGILMYGKKTSYKELAKWFFYKE